MGRIGTWYGAWIGILAFGVLSGVPRTAWSQPPAGASAAERMFNILDRDGSKSIQGAEWDRLSRLRDWVKSNGVDVSAPTDLPTFLGIYDRFMKDGLGSRSTSSGSTTSTPAASPAPSTAPAQPSTQSPSSPAPTAPVTGSPPPAAGTPAPAASSSGLPGQYASRDTDGDGQIGLYEWPRSEIKEFLRLDINQDGFLTARELAQSGTGATLQAATMPASSPGVGAEFEPIASFELGPVATGRPLIADTGVPTQSAFSNASETRPVESSPMIASTSVPSAVTPGSPTVGPQRVSAPATNSGSPFTGLSSGGPNDAQNQRATFVFRQLDSNNDGTLSADEWERVRGTRSFFERSGITLTPPVSRDEFFRLYQQASDAAASATADGDDEGDDGDDGDDPDPDGDDDDPDEPEEEEDE